VTQPTQLVEIFFDTTWEDVTSFVRNINITRGKSRELDRYPAGTATFEFDNNDRRFDPTYSLSPYAGNIVPLKRIRVSSNGKMQFTGSIQDWNLSYTPNGNNIASVICADDTRLIANEVLPETLTESEFSGQRINRVLDLISWPIDRRDVDNGAQLLGADTIPTNAKAIEYLQLVADSEPGAVFIGKDGKVVFRDRTIAPTSTIPSLSDSGTAIPYTDLSVIYGSEMLYNQIFITNAITSGTAVASSPESQALYGTLALELDGYLQANQEDTQDIANFYANKFGNPEYRFESVSVVLQNVTATQQNQLLDIDMNGIVEVRFTPGNPKVGDQIVEYGEVIGITHDISQTSHKISFKLATLNNTFLVLDDPIFGRLDTNALAW
jgi:hypothetical protein